ncbi:MAG: hypothetical protein Q9186_005229 [Xanthomendoza sp. 1 TL-2023]
MPNLNRYLSFIYDGVDDDSGGVKRFMLNPRLDPTRTNVVLVYRGSFNPPHRGHLAVLWHAFHQLSQPLNIIAAYIRLRPDKSIERKYGHKEGARIFSLEERVRLWKEDPAFPPWAWVYEHYKGGASALQERLKAFARADKCTIRFADLHGPDCYDGTGFSEMTILTDVAREAGFDHPNGLEFCHSIGCGPWLLDDGKNKTRAPTKLQMQREYETQRQRKETIEEEEREEIRREQRFAVGKENARKAVEEKYSSVLDMSASLLHGASHLAIAKVDGLLGIEDQHTTPVTPIKTQTKESVATQLSKLCSPQPVSVCWQEHSRPKKSLRFLRSTPEQHTPFRGISSTLIQEKIMELNGYKLKAAIESMALSPALLWDMLLPSRLRNNKDPATVCSQLDGPICLDREQDLSTTHHPLPNRPSASPLLGPTTTTTNRVPINRHMHIRSYQRGTQTVDDMVLPMRVSRCVRSHAVDAMRGESENLRVFKSAVVGMKRKRHIFDDGHVALVTRLSRRRTENRQ